jgi:hypothetical protein
VDDDGVEKATMKIRILPVAKEFQPDKQNYRMPTHGRDWGVEQDLLGWLRQHPELITDDPGEAAWDYLPVYWNRIYINWNWGQDGHDKIQNEILRLVSRNRRTFTVCEYDIKSMQPFYDLCNMVVFTASRRDSGHDGNIDIPLLCSPHSLPPRMPEKRYLASFVGNLQTDGIRLEMQETFAGQGDIEILNDNRGPEFFVNLMLSSYIALSPRGHGGQSFRFYEAMDLGVVPYHIGTPDTRPFKRWIKWDECSLYAPTVINVQLPNDTTRLKTMGWKARNVYRNQLQYGKWCPYVLKELEQL